METGVQRKCHGNKVKELLRTLSSLANDTFVHQCHVQSFSLHHRATSEEFWPFRQSSVFFPRIFVQITIVHLIAVPSVVVEVEQGHTFKGRAR